MMFLTSLMLFTATHGYTCPNGEKKDISIELAHIQDISADGGHGFPANIAKELQDAFQGISNKADGKAKFSVSLAYNRSYVDYKVDSDFKCDDPLTHGFVPFGPDLDHTWSILKNKHMYWKTTSMTTMMDPLFRIVNEWAGRDREKGTYRIAFMSTDSCFREPGRYHQVDDTLVEAWKTDRGFEFPLSGERIPHCQMRDFVSMDEMAEELSDKRVNMAVLIDGNNPDMACSGDYAGYTETIKSFYQRFQNSLLEEDMYSSFDLSFSVYKNALSGYSIMYQKLVDDIVCNSDSGRAVYSVFMAAFVMMMMIF